jgi:hypothetical protein
LTGLSHSSFRVRDETVVRDRQAATGLAMVRMSLLGSSIRTKTTGETPRQLAGHVRRVNRIRIHEVCNCRLARLGELRAFVYVVTS